MLTARVTGFDMTFFTVKGQLWVTDNTFLPHFCLVFANKLFTGGW